MRTFSDLPVEFLLDNLFPTLPVRDLLALGSTNKHLHALCKDDTFWKRKCESDFNFSGSRTARREGWDFLYRGLSKPRAYVWGHSDNGRLGIPLEQISRTAFRGVPYPVQVNIPGKRIVELIAGGWSFHALDHEGTVFVWGTLDGTALFLRSDGFSTPQKTATTPLRLDLPSPVKALSCGRMHSMALDSKGHIWTFISWGRPYRLVTPSLDCSSNDSTPIQIECGWMYSAALTRDGQVFIWWPFGDDILRQFVERNSEMDAEGNKKALLTSSGSIPCVTWTLAHNPLRLPPLPILPIRADDYDNTPTKLQRIAAMEHSLIGLTNKGHVLKFATVTDSQTAAVGRWEYLPHFCELEKIRQHPVFSSDEVPAEALLITPEDIQITHISAHFGHFVAYSTGPSSIVLIGNGDTHEKDQAEIVPELQYKSIISVALGDYHKAALTSDGHLYTWGAYMNGALGLGDPKKIPAGEPGGFALSTTNRGDHRNFHTGQVPDVKVPTEVRFDHDLKHKKDKFCFAIAAAGWHTGALVIDLEPDDEEEEEEETENTEHHDDSGEDDHEPIARMPGSFPFPIIGPRRGAHLPIVRGHRRGQGRGRGGHTDT